MLRLFSVAFGTILIAFSLLAIASSAQQNGENNGWETLHSVVSHRGVRINPVAPPSPPPAEEPTPSVPDPIPGPSAERPSAEDEPEPLPPPSPDICGPVRVRINDTEPPAARLAENHGAAVNARIFDIAAVAPDEPAEEDCGQVDARIYDTKSSADSGPARDSSKHAHAKRAKDGGGKHAGLSRYRGRIRCAAREGLGTRGGCGTREGCGRHGAFGPDGLGPQCACCQMWQHNMYFPEMHGYYYFRPYNWTLIGEHQQLTAQWGVDPRNPYSNELFQQVYADYFAEQAAPETPQTLAEPEEPETPLPPDEG